MLFTSLEFLLLFMPIAVGVHFLLPGKAKNAWLVLASLFFYAWGEPQFVWIMLLSILFNYAGALAIGRAREGSSGRRALLVLVLSVDLGILFVYKYLGFALENLFRILPSMGAQVPEIVLPLGISFFTFQEISYAVDVYRGTPPRKNLLEIALYISLFPQLIAGPIVRYSALETQLTGRRITGQGFARGLLRFMGGFSKKVLLANVLAQTADLAFGQGGSSACMAWLGALCYSLQILFDFGGYSDMAIGLGQMMGFSLPENFNAPYLSRTVTEFWRRWHISLGTWFRDYVYIPLGGSRGQSGARLAFNLLTVWLLTGLWHGADWTFVLWGGLYGVLILAEKQTGIPERSRQWHAPARALYRAGTLLAVGLGWVLFRAETPGAAGTYLGQMLGLGVPFADGAFVFAFRQALIPLAAGVLCAASVPARIRQRLCIAGGRWQVLGECGGDVLRVLLFVFAFTFLVMNAHDPFIYFNF